MRLDPRPLLIQLALATLGALAISAPVRAEALQPVQSFGGSPRVWVPPSPVVWSREDPAGLPPYNPFGLISLTSDNHQVNSFAWPLYILLSATDNPAATQATSQSTGPYVRLYNSSSGSPWAAAFHTDEYHGVAYNGLKPDSLAEQAHGTTIGFNDELRRESPYGTMIGAEFNTLGPIPPDAAINLDGKFKTGIRLGSNDISMKPGQRVILAPGVYLTYDAKTDRVEVWRHGRRVRSF